MRQQQEPKTGRHIEDTNADIVLENMKLVFEIYMLNDLMSDSIQEVCSFVVSVVFQILVSISPLPSLEMNFPFAACIRSFIQLPLILGVQQMPRA